MSETVLETRGLNKSFGALEFAERCIVMNRGRITRDGGSEELRDDHELLHRLIGVEAGASAGGD